MKPDIRSFEEATDSIFGDILRERKPKRKVKIGLLTCGYFEYWRMYPDTLKSNVKQNLEIVEKRFKNQFEDVVCSGMVDTLNAADDAGKLFEQENIDLLVVVEGTYTPDFISLHAINYVRDVPIILFSIQEDEIINRNGNYVDSLSNSGIIGIAQLSGTFCKMGRPYELVVGSVNDDRAYDKIRAYIQAVQAIKDIREANIGVIGHVFRGMYDLELSKTFLKARFDVNVIYIQSSHLLNEFRLVSEEDVRDKSKALISRFKTRGILDEDIYKAVKLAIAMEKLAHKFKLDAMCFLDQHFIQRQTLTSARMGASLLMETTDLTISCEGDLGGLVMMMIMRSISGHASLMGEWGEYDIEENGILVVGHGIGTPDLAKSDEDITMTRTPEEWGFKGAGLNYEFILRPGTVTVGHFIETPNGYKMLVSLLESVEFPTLAYDEIHAMLRTKTCVKKYLETLLKGGVTHHCIVGMGDMSQVLINIASLLNIETLYLE